MEALRAGYQPKNIPIMVQTANERTMLPVEMEIG